MFAAHQSHWVFTSISMFSFEDSIIQNELVMNEKGLCNASAVWLTLINQ